MLKDIVKNLEASSTLKINEILEPIDIDLTSRFSIELDILYIY